MNEAQPSGNVFPAEIFGLFAGMIDQTAVQRFHNAIALACQGGARTIHMLFQTNGGHIGDGISLYNLFRASPVEIVLYNVGSITSIGVIAYLGATKRMTSTYGAFMIHRSYLNPIGATADKMAAAAGQLLMEDTRVEAILKSHTKIPADRWEQHKYSDVWLSADDALRFEIAEKIEEFAPPLGTRLFNVWPPQN